MNMTATRRNADGYLNLIEYKRSAPSARNAPEPALQNALNAVAFPKGADIIKAIVERFPNKTHPRLLATNETFGRLRNEVKMPGLKKDWYEELRKVCDEFLSAPVSVFEKLDGVRLLFISRVVFARTTCLSMLWQLSGEDKYAARAVEEMLAAAKFPGWNPAHFLDVAEMTAALAFGYDWLYHYLTPGQRETVETAIINFGLKESDNQLWDKRGFYSKTNNWNNVCNGSISLGAIALADVVPELAGDLLEAAIRTTPKSLAHFAPDGGHPEGCIYWYYGTMFLSYMLAALETAAGTDYGISNIPGLPQTGFFPLYLLGTSLKMFNFSDCSEDLEALRGSQFLWFAKKYNQPVFSWMKTFMPAAKNLPFDILWYDPQNMKTPTEVNLPLSRVFHGMESVAVMRGDWADPNAIYAAIKAGDNQSGHGDLDIGVFVFDALGKR